jgi:hypothetical protein
MPSEHRSRPEILVSGDSEARVMSLEELQVLALWPGRARRTTKDSRRFHPKEEHTIVTGITPLPGVGHFTFGQSRFRITHASSISPASTEKTTRRFPLTRRAWLACNSVS